MIQIQLDSKHIKQLLPIFEKEVAKNPDGYINIQLGSVPKDNFFPGYFWSEDVDC